MSLRYGRRSSGGTEIDVPADAALVVGVGSAGALAATATARALADAAVVLVATSGSATAGVDEGAGEVLAIAGADVAAAVSPDVDDFERALSPARDEHPVCAPSAHAARTTVAKFAGRITRSPC
ncbi:MAG: hypothetical protein U0167_02210 [bacterium]